MIIKLNCVYVDMYVYVNMYDACVCTCMRMCRGMSLCVCE